MGVRLILGSLVAAVLPLSVQAEAQVQSPASTSREGEIIVTGNREPEGPSVITQLRDMIDESETSQLARF